ncbi:hypothetical protein [Christensenella tenuis]|uniref:Uncharacterized protein n=1 Tax=Christensenella tenuis TaxID=2763033 RepID=A0ABR7EGE5_9FIRM|nr:hypothetical protein [Christensenella tenuis]MBC5648114.1 hypothetical protein [Christensenella tenuis]
MEKQDINILGHISNGYFPTKRVTGRIASGWSRPAQRACLSWWPDGGSTASRETATAPPHDKTLLRKNSVKVVAI